MKDELLKVLQDENIGLDTVVMICDAISADARYNMWFVDVVKKQATEQQARECLEHGERLIKQCSVIVSEFEHDHNLPKFEAAIQTLTEKLSALTKSMPKRR
jgi:stress response protein SCP2